MDSIIYDIFAIGAQFSLFDVPTYTVDIPQYIWNADSLPGHKESDKQVDVLLVPVTPTDESDTLYNHTEAPRTEDESSILVNDNCQNMSKQGEDLFVNLFPLELGHSQQTVHETLSTFVDTKHAATKGK